MNHYLIKLAILFKLCYSFIRTGHLFKRGYIPLIRNNLNTLDSLSKELPSEYASFKGNNVIIDDSNVANYETSIDDLLDTKLLGFDLEYVPDYYSNLDYSYKRCKPSIVQICGDSTCFIYLIYKIGYIPNKGMFITSFILQVSHGAPSDMRLLFKHYGTKCTNFVDLKDLCKDYNIYPASLKNATESVLNLKLNKKQQCSNWEADKLVPDQISYASTDAWVTREIFIKLNPAKISKIFLNSEGDIEKQ
ncbi:DNA binding protein, putative [Theileria annulata]|uniref:3'-5' exonuclease n=1 Tax=Theileria annulata TaxID=5874 RepID=Q4UDG4_THEAN|nr:DNA binding protein, putative [Theileria annulata]CAI74875.1 DNA binding protein, putative [Theileria annulata]|eukprot:XP_952607.1 DNA binding protein, putative [Theileria annulata]